MAWVKKRAAVKIYDGADVLVYTFDDVGDFSISGLEEGDQEAVEFKNRDRHGGWVEGPDVEHQISFSFRPERLSYSHPTVKRPIDVILANGAAAGFVNCNPVTTGPFTWRVVSEVTDGVVTAAAALADTRLSATLDESGETFICQVSGRGYGLTHT